MRSLGLFLQATIWDVVCSCNPTSLVSLALLWAEYQCRDYGSSVNSSPKNNWIFLACHIATGCMCAFLIGRNLGCQDIWIYATVIDRLVAFRDSLLSYLGKWMKPFESNSGWFYVCTNVKKVSGNKLKCVVFSKLWKRWDKWLDNIEKYKIFCVREHTSSSMALLLRQTK